MGSIELSLSTAQLTTAGSFDRAPSILPGRVDPAMFGMVVLELVGLILVGQAIAAWWAGARLRVKTCPISDIRRGRVTLSGTSEPAWAVVISPFGQRACIWYEARSTIGEYRTARSVFYEVNAVPFVLNDGTGRVLVLGRRARWDSSRGHSQAVADVRSGDLGSSFSSSLADSPDPLQSDSSERTPPDLLPGEHREQLVAVGERVTVTGEVLDPRGALWGIDACPDGGSSLGLPGELVIGPGRLLGLAVVAGYPEDLAARARPRLLFGVVGVLLILAMLIGVAANLAH